MVLTPNSNNDVFDVDFDVDLDFETAPPPFYDEDAAAQLCLMPEAAIPPPPVSKAPKLVRAQTSPPPNRIREWDHDKTHAHAHAKLAKLRSYDSMKFPEVATPGRARGGTYGRLKNVGRARSRGISRWELPWTKHAHGHVAASNKNQSSVKLHFLSGPSAKKVQNDDTSSRATFGLRRFQSKCLPIF